MPPVAVPGDPDPDEVEALKRLAAGIINTQGNRFIKELLRDKGLRIGTNKADFERNIVDAIESGALRLSDVDEWLRRVEGWGNQHVYLYNVRPALRPSLTLETVQERVHEAGLDSVWDGTTTLEFPDQPTLTSISFQDNVLRLVWQEASPGWIPAPEKNFQRQEGLDLLEYRAYRAIEQRAVMRFEARVDSALAGLFLANPIQDAGHQDAVAEARRVIGLLLDLRELDAGQVDVSVISRNLDQRSMPTNAAPEPDVKTQKSRLASGGAYVEFAANDPDKSYYAEPAVQNVRRAIRQQQLQAFDGTGGVFIFKTADPTAPRELRVQLYGEGERIRLWAQMKADEVWEILTKLSTYQ